MREINLFFKRLFDIFSCSVAVIILLPLFLGVVIAIRIESKGAVIFKQKRLGKGGKEFEIYKFRTMIPNAEFIGEGLRVSSENDPRITKVGRFLRATSLDELPQLFNVILGTMSVVGPRPPVVYHPYKGYQNYPEWGKKRFTMRPGITGLAQVTVRNSVSWDERIRIDNTYVENFSFLGDLKIIFHTFDRVLGKKNVY